MHSCRENKTGRLLKSREGGRGEEAQRQRDCNFTRPGNCAASLFGMHEAAVSNGRRRVSARRDSSTTRYFSIRIPRSCPVKRYSRLARHNWEIGRSRGAITPYTCSFHRFLPFFRGNNDFERYKSNLIFLIFLRGRILHAITSLSFERSSKERIR